MTFQRLQNTDAYILMEFVRATKYLLIFQPTPAIQAEMAVVGKPYLQRLLNNGHSLQTCADLMRAAHGLPSRPVREVQTA